MDRGPCRERTFPFRLAPFFERRYGSYLRWMVHLLERLGPTCTRALWQAACADYDETLLMEILTRGWNSVAEEEATDREAITANLLAEWFPWPIETVSADEARRLVEETPPLLQIGQSFPSLDVQRESTAYEALHLIFDGEALLAESLIDRHGKEGELIVYDLIRDGRIAAGQGKTGTVAQFMADWLATPTEPDIFTAGLEIEVIQASDRESVTHVRECEWARYFRDHHPRVGYLIACSTDEVAIKSFNEHLRMQRSSTLMEGGEVCDFRIYAVQ